MQHEPIPGGVDGDEGTIGTCDEDCEHCKATESRKR